MECASLSYEGRSAGTGEPGNRGTGEVRESEEPEKGGGGEEVVVCMSPPEISLLIS